MATRAPTWTSRLVRKLNAARDLFAAATRAGARGALDEYAMLAPLSEDAIAEFERAHAIDLPEDYRLFLEHVSEGSTGHGVRPLRARPENVELDERQLAIQSGGCATD